MTFVKLGGVAANPDVAGHTPQATPGDDVVGAPPTTPVEPLPESAPPQQATPTVADPNEPAKELPLDNPTPTTPQPVPAGGSSNT